MTNSFNKGDLIYNERFNEYAVYIGQCNMGWMDTSMPYVHRREIERTRLHMGESMIDLGDMGIVKTWRDGSMPTKSNGSDSHQTDG